MPILVLTVLIYSFGLFAIGNAIRFIPMWIDERRHFFFRFASVISAAALALAALQAIETGLWAIAYLLLGARSVERRDCLRTDHGVLLRRPAGRAEAFRRRDSRARSVIGVPSVGLTENVQGRQSVFAPILSAIHGGARTPGRLE